MTPSTPSITVGLIHCCVYGVLIYDNEHVSGRTQTCLAKTRREGTTEKARAENSAPSKMQGWKTGERKTRHQMAGVEMARTENAAPKCRGGKGEKMYI